MNIYYVKAYHGKELIASRRVYSLDKAIKVNRYISMRIKQEGWFKPVLKRYNVRIVVTKE